HGRRQARAAGPDDEDIEFVSGAQRCGRFTVGSRDRCRRRCGHSVSSSGISGAGALLRVLSCGGFAVGAWTQTAVVAALAAGEESAAGVVPTPASSRPVM